ncbi:MAG: preprotein translocase subunit YajC [Oscillospiraceae bacterium]|jgi:preprotein translocase subunit YajC|nr:preprotein translocase subunit YajC [Oscillospiraceae bacterium]
MFNYFNPIALADEVQQDAGLFGNPMTMILIYGVIIVGLYFILIRPSSKKKKAEQEMKSSIVIGDDITTIGGIVGRVVAIKEETDEFVIETGADKTKMKLKRWAISTIDTEKPAAEKAANEKKGFFARFAKKDAPADDKKAE